MREKISIDANDLGVKEISEKTEFLEGLKFIERMCNKTPTKGIHHCSICHQRCDSILFSWKTENFVFKWDSILYHAVKEHGIKPPNSFIKDVLKAYNNDLKKDWAVKEAMGVLGEKIFPAGRVTKVMLRNFIVDTWLRNASSEGELIIKNRYLKDSSSVKIRNK